MCSQVEQYDFRAFGAAIKAARIKEGMTRDDAAGFVGINARYLTNIENKGQVPSFRVLYRLVTLFHLSVDQFIYPDAETDKSVLRRQLDSVLDGFDNKKLIIMRATALGITQAEEA
jgi:transcriptional regulator with XRE-family HTH domain